MRIAKIQIKNFKSHEYYLQEIEDKFNHIVIYGDNGVGKTNILECFSYFSNSSGLRGDRLEKLIPLQKKKELVDTNIFLKVYSGNHHINLLFTINKIGEDLKKNFFLDDKKSSLLNIKSYISFIWLTPYMDKIMYEGQSIKRNFIDKMITQNDKTFNQILISYKKDTAERLAILKNSKDDKWLNIIEKKLAANTFNIFQIRRKFAQKLNKIIQEKLSNFKKVELRYKNNFFSNLEKKQEVIDHFEKKFKLNRQIDEISKKTNFGINSDEIIFFDKKNEINSESCSTGEQKSSLLTIILANCWKLKSEEKDFILLLDEATSHIDENNFEKLFKEVSKFETQIWYTGTSKKLFQVIENKGFFIHLQ